MRVFEAIHLFQVIIEIHFYCMNFTLMQVHGFTTSLLACDGATPNLTVVKNTHGYSGAYGTNEHLSNKYKVKPYFVKPFNSPNLIHWLICPSHQVQYICNDFRLYDLCICLVEEHDLHSSQRSGSRDFTLNANQFRWQAIIDMFDRDCSSVKKGNARVIPSLHHPRLVDQTYCCTSQNYAGKLSYLNQQRILWNTTS